MATLTETIANELLDALDDPDGLERVMTQHRGSKGPLYGGLARATMWLHQHVHELNNRAARLKADNEILGEKVEALDQKRSMLEKEVGRSDAHGGNSGDDNHDNHGDNHDHARQTTMSQIVGLFVSTVIAKPR